MPMLTPTAAATLTEPSLVSALGAFFESVEVFALSESLSLTLPPSAVFLLPAVSNCAATFWSTVLSSLVSSAVVPAATSSFV